MGTASLVATLAHVKRYGLSNQELLTRVRLEHEKERTGLLLAKLERLSHEDALTGLANRRRWDAELAGECASARQRDTLLGVVLLDIDHFKSVNDRHGHAGGDEALRQVARLLTGCVRDGDLVARPGRRRARRPDARRRPRPGRGAGRAAAHRGGRPPAGRLRGRRAEPVPRGGRRLRASGSIRWSSCRRPTPTSTAPRSPATRWVLP